MMERAWLFASLDSWFFRDSSPFEAGEGGRAELHSKFPPSILTLQGAIRTALAMAQGWKPPEKGREGSTFPKNLGGPDDLGCLNMRGPFLLFRGERLYSIPSFLLFNQGSRDKSKKFVRMTPGPEVSCDIGSVSLPIPEERVSRLKTAESYFLTAKGMGIVLAGRTPNDGEYYSAKELWLEERRVGLTLDYMTRTAQDHMLYSVAHVRPVQELEIEVLESGAEQDWVGKIPEYIRIGGEGRLAKIKVENECSSYPLFPQLLKRNNLVHYTVTLITPGFFMKTGDVLRNGPDGMPGKCVAACIGKLDVVGGWDLQRKVSRPTQPYLPPGSTWFYQAEPGCEGKLYSLHGSCVGDKKSFGYAQVLIGTWEGIA